MTKLRAYMEVLAAIDSHERRGSEEAAVASETATAAAPYVSPLRRRLRRRRGEMLGVRRVSRSDRWQAPSGVHFCPVVLTPRDDAPLFVPV
jgi:hypothetical protein